MLREFNTVSMVAAHWGCSMDTVYNLICAGSLDAIRIGSLYRIRREHVEEYEAKNSTKLQAKIERDQARKVFESVEGPHEIARRAAMQWNRRK